MLMRRRLLQALAACGPLLLVRQSWAGDGTDDASETPELQAVRQVAEEVGEAWARLDAKAMGAHYTEDADYVNIMGLVLEGRKAIEVRHAEIFTTVLRGSHASFEVRSVRMLAPGVALADVNGAVMDIKTPPTGLTLDADGAVRSRIKHILIKKEGAWRVVSSQTTQVVARERR